MIGDRRIVFAQPLQRSNLCASHRQRRWLTYLSQTIRNSWVPQRRSILFGQMTAEGLFASAATPTFSQHGGKSLRGFALTVSSAGGTVYYTTDGTDPRERFSGAVSASAQPYVNGVPLVLNESTVVKMRTLDGEWSALASAQFEVASLGTPLAITEIM